jgi:hypothetical protein
MGLASLVSRHPNSDCLANRARLKAAYRRVDLCALLGLTAQLQQKTKWDVCDCIGSLACLFISARSDRFRNELTFFAKGHRCGYCLDRSGSDNGRLPCPRAQRVLVICWSFQSCRRGCSRSLPPLSIAIAWFWLIFNLGGAVGSFASFGINYDNKSSTVTDGTC